MENFSIKIDENVRLRLYKICRLCGDDNPNNSDILANHKKSTNVDPDFHKKIFDCIGIQVTKGDKMPQTACDVCREKINDFFDFREMCLATDVQTRRLLGLPEMIVPKLDPGLDAIEDDKTEVEKTIKKKNPVAIKALKSSKSLKCEKRSSVESRKTSLDVKRTLPETRRLSTAEARRTALPDIKKAPPDIRKGPSDTKKDSKHKSQVDLKKACLDVKKTPSDAKRQPLNVKKVVKLERDKSLLKLKKKVQIVAEQISDVDLKKEDPERLARAKKRKASSDLLTEKPPNKRERLRETIIRKFKNPEVALDAVAVNVTCTICSKSFCNAGELHRHLDTDHIPRVVSFHCVRCNESLEKKQDIKDHNLWHKLSKTPYECGRCTKTITNLAVYTKHVQNCTGFVQDFEYKTKICVTCQEEFETQNLYNWHKCVINQLKCEVCQQKFTKKGAMVKHVVRCSAIGLSTSLPVVDSAIVPDPEQEPTSDAEPEIHDHFADGNNSDEDDVEINLKPNLEIDIEAPREELEQENKESAPFVVIPSATTSTEVSRPSSNSSSSIPAMISARTTSMHSNIADDEASNTSNILISKVVAPMVCIKIESALRSSVASNAAVRVKSEVIDSAYKGLYNASACHTIKQEHPEETPDESNHAPPIDAAVGDEMDEWNDDVHGDAASSRSVSPTTSPIPPSDPTPPPKPTLKLVIKKQHGKLNSSFVEGSDIPRDECESQPKKKKKKKAKIFRIPKGLAYRLKQERMQEGNDDGSSETNNENEEDEPLQHQLPVISNVCSKYTDKAIKDKMEVDLGHVHQIQIKQERLESDDIEQNRVSQDLTNNLTNDAGDAEVQNTSPAVSVVIKRSKTRGKMKNAQNTIPATTVKIKEEKIDNDQEVTSIYDASEKQAAVVQIKQERFDEDEDVPNATGSEQQKTTVYDGMSDEEISNQIQQKTPDNRSILRSGRSKSKGAITEKLFAEQVPIKQESLDPDVTETNANQIRPAVSERIINASTEYWDDQALQRKLPVISNVCSKLSKPKRTKDTSHNRLASHTLVRVKQERKDTDDTESAIAYNSPIIEQISSESFNTRLEKNLGRLDNRNELDFRIQVKQERIETSEGDSSEPDENDVTIAGADQVMPAVPDFATPNDSRLMSTKSPEIQVKQERVNDEYVDENPEEDSESDQDTIEEEILTVTKKNNPKVPNSKLQKTSDHHLHTRSVDTNILVKEERAESEEREMNLSPVLPIISQVFSQHVKTEVDGETAGGSTAINPTVEKVRIKKEKEINVCVIDTDCEDDEMIEAERPNIPVISLLSPDRSNNDIERLNSQLTSVHVKLERVDVGECSAVNEINKIRAINVPTGLVLSGQKMQTNQSKSTKKVRAIDANVRIKQEKGSSDEVSQPITRLNRTKDISTQNTMKESTTTLTNSTSGCDKATTQLSSTTTTDDIRIKEERSDDDEDDSEVQLVDLTEVIEIPDESLQVVVPTQSKQPKVCKKDKILKKTNQSAENLIHMEQEEAEKEKDMFYGEEESLDLGILKRPSTVINPLAACLKRASRKRKNINPLNPANLDLLQTRIKRERVDDNYERDDLLEGMRSEETNASTSTGPTEEETRVNNESISLFNHVQIKQEPLDNPHVRKTGALSTVNKLHNVNPSRKRSKNHDNVIARPNPEISNDQNNPNQESRRAPMLRIKSEFNAFNFKGDVNTPEISSIPEKENIGHEIAIKTEPIFDMPIKEELPYDSEAEETEEQVCDRIKDEPQEFYATEEVQSPLQDNQGEQDSDVFSAESEDTLNEVSHSEGDYGRSEAISGNIEQVNVIEKESQKKEEDWQEATTSSRIASQQDALLQKTSATLKDALFSIEKSIAKNSSEKPPLATADSAHEMISPEIDNLVNASKITIQEKDETSVLASQTLVEDIGLCQPENENDFVKEVYKNITANSDTREKGHSPNLTIGNSSRLVENLKDNPHLDFANNSGMQEPSHCDTKNIHSMDATTDDEADHGEKSLPSVSLQVDPGTCEIESTNQKFFEAPDNPKPTVVCAQSKEIKQSKMTEMVQVEKTHPSECIAKKTKQEKSALDSLKSEYLGKNSGYMQDVKRAPDAFESDPGDQQDSHEHGVSIERQNIMDTKLEDVNNERVSDECKVTKNSIQATNEEDNNVDVICSRGENREANDENRVSTIVPIAEDSLCGGGATIGDAMDDRVTACDEKTSDSENNTDDSSEDSPATESDSNCNQKLKDLIKDNDNLLGFFEHELSRNNDSSSEERTMDKKLSDYDVDNSDETSNVHPEILTAVKVDKSVSLDKPSQDCGMNSENVLDTDKEDAINATELQPEDTSKQKDDESYADATKKAVFNDKAVVAESSSFKTLTDDKTTQKLSPLGTEADQNAAVETNVSSSKYATTTALPVPTASDLSQFCPPPTQSLAPVNPPTVNFSINTLIGATNAPSSSSLINAVAPSITALPKAIVSPTISPSISSFNSSPLSSFERIPSSSLIGPLISNTTFNAPINPITSINSIESSSNVSVMPSLVSSNVGQQVPTSLTAPSAFSSASGHSATSSSFYSDPASRLNMLHINEIAENNNNANIERELQNDLDSISSSSNINSDETTVNNLSELSESNALINSNNENHAAPDH